jgi:YHS domain-containing protein
MDTLLSVLIWGGLFFLMMRFGCGSHMFKRGHGAGGDEAASAQGPGGGCGSGGGKRLEKAAEAERLTWVAPEKDTDPVCGKTVYTNAARPSLHDGQVYYFCSRECREAFEVLPEHYVGLGEPYNVRRLDHTPDQGERHGREHSNH